MKKLLISIVGLDCGGAERVLSILSKAFADNFSEVTILTWKDTNIFYEYDKRIKIVCIEKVISSSNWIKKIVFFRKYTRDYNPNIILSFLAKSSIPVLLSTIFLKTKVIVAERNDPRRLKGGLLMIFIRDIIYNLAAGILEQTEQNKLYFKGAKYLKTEVIYNPIIFRDIEPGSSINIGKKNKIVNVGRLSKQKDQITLIKAFSIFLKDHPDYQLYIYGDGEEKSNLITFIKENNLTSKVILAGKCTNILNEISDSKVFVLSSIFEGMPNALIEAMCLGLPCISTKVSGANELIKDGINGFLVDIGDYEEIAEKLKLLCDNSKLSTDVSIEATKLYNQLNLEIISDQWVKYLFKQATN